ncbi:ABC-type antimicrobial peptide transport system permease subunit [Agromyces terreus]|uniref:ABC-type antimicrobial peptide transport system permease subunit n=1 Tax=Agromyces terreus TaxID=424795 RepID=A0A9X2GVL6_9MICO|nr:ABC transporter permease [Agromyces terreus]MCP2369825.1 ABC-type antimicrobial peptide transport system permease subunit [Agromyces terreus]
MFFTYLRRELAGRRRQTAIIAIGMALAIALVIIVNSVASGVKSAQASVLESVYGVGTDITVAQSPTPPEEGEGGQGGRPRFEFDAGAGTTTDGTTEISQSRLMAGFGASTFDEEALDTVLGVDDVAAASATLSLTNTTFNGEMPQFQQNGEGTAQAAPGTDAQAEPPQGGPDGAGGSAFDVDSFSVLGLDPSADAIGPLSAVTLAEGRTLDADDAGANVAVLDADYATSAELAVGDTIDIGGTEFEVVGTVTSNAADSASASNVYIPLDVAQTLSGEEGMISNVYVQAASSTDIAQVQADLEAALPDATVSTQEDLASSVSGSLSTASALVSNLGLWLSLAVLVAAFLIAILFTISGVTRRTREFGTLKAIGWSDRRIVGQVAGESLVQGLIGGALGIAIGLIGIVVINLVAPTLSGSASSGGFDLAGGQGGQGGATGGEGGGAQGGRGFGGPMAQTAAATTEVALNAPITVSVIAIAVGIAVLGGLLAGAIGGWRASRLRPAEALRSVG